MTLLVSIKFKIPQLALDYTKALYTRVFNERHFASNCQSVEELNCRKLLKLTEKKTKWRLRYLCIQCFEVLCTQALFILCF